VLTNPNDETTFGYDNTVATLIDSNTRMWNHNNIRNRFDSTTAEAIINIPLLSHIAEDRQVWKAEKNGYYTVKSAYWLCVEDLIDTSHFRVPGFWSRIWKLKASPKVKNLIWRICRGCLPMRARIRDKGIHCPSNSVACEDNFEDSMHILFDCNMSVQIWHMCGLWSHIQEAVRTTGTPAVAIFCYCRSLTSSKQHYGLQLFGVYGSITI
jgi:hypothetical protein